MPYPRPLFAPIPPPERRPDSRPVRVWDWLGARSLRQRLGVAAVGAALIATGLVIALTSDAPALRTAALPPTPPSPSGFVSSAPPLHLSFGPASAPVSSGRAAPPPSCAGSTVTGQGSAPVRICVPAIGVNASVIQLGLNADRTVQVPALSQVREAGWYRYSPAPGADGPTIILGHVDSAQYGRGVFFDLGKLHSGDLVSVSRGDGSVVTFRISEVAEYPKTGFPTTKVYGDTAGPTIRLITCGGRFDSATGSYVDNIVAYGELSSVG